MKGRWKCKECGGTTATEAVRTEVDGKVSFRFEKPLCVPCAEKALNEAGLGI